jgi:hypothetical protein
MVWHKLNRRGMIYCLYRGFAAAAIITMSG